MRNNINSCKELGKEQDLFCNKCKVTTEHTIIADAHTTKTFKDYDEIHGMIETYEYNNHYILQCGGCKSIAFKTQSIHSEDISSGIVEPTFEAIYPTPQERINIFDNNYNLNDEIKNIYTETILAFNYEQPIMTAIGIRAVIEAICEEQEIDGNLFNQIDGLKKKEILTSSQVDTLHKLRVLGNNAVHDRKVHTKEQLSIALDIVEHLIKEIYDITPKSKIFDDKGE